MWSPARIRVSRGRGLLDRVDVLVDRVGRPLVPVLGDPLLRRDHLDVLVELAAEELPALVDVPVQADGLVLRQDEDLAEVGVDAVGQREVDDPVDPAEGDGRLGPVARQGFQPGPPPPGQDDGQNVTMHQATSAPSMSRTMGRRPIVPHEGRASQRVSAARGRRFVRPGGQPPEAPGNTSGPRGVSVSSPRFCVALTARSYSARATITLGQSIVPRRPFDRAICRMRNELLGDARDRPPVPPALAPCRPDPRRGSARLGLCRSGPTTGSRTCRPPTSPPQEEGRPPLPLRLARGRRRLLEPRQPLATA